ncbi:MAG: phosphoribosylglycinamide formyltransferase [Spirochaetota bacterium]
MKKKRIVVFISGRGSNFMAIHREIIKGNINGEIVAVISDNPDAGGLSYAREKGIPCAIFEKKKEEKRSQYFERVMSYLDELKVDLILLAGFMRVLSENIVKRYRNRIMNIHPALLPSFPGENAQKQAFEYGVKISGCTVHFVDEGVDTGPIIFQEAVPVLDGDDADSLTARILEREHIIYPKAVKYFCEERLFVNGRHVFVKEELSI